MTRHVAAVRRARYVGGHTTQVNYIWTGRLAEFVYQATCSTCGELVEVSDEDRAWVAAQDHAKP